jgi:hypothetical protein
MNQVQSIDEPVLVVKINRTGIDKKPSLTRHERIKMNRQR